MPRGELRTRKLKLTRFDQGYFPNREFDDVPEGGSPECRHVFHRHSDLRPFPGMELVNSVQAPTSGQGIHYVETDSLSSRVAVFGTGFFYDNGGTWTDITGAAVIGSGDRVQFLNHQRGVNEYVIGCPGNGNPPFRSDGTTAATLLGGSPPNFNTIAKYHRFIFGAVDENVYPSDVDNPELWDTTEWVIPYSRTVTCLIDNDSKLAVMMGDHIGSIQGYDIIDFVAEDSEISNFGCVGKLAATKCAWGDDDSKLNVVATIAQNGLWVFDAAFNADKIFGDNWIQEFNKSNLSKSSIAYWKDENLLFVAMPFGAATEPDHLTIVNTKTGAFWPGPEIHGNYIRDLASMKDANGDEFIYFVDNNGYAFKFDMDATDYHTGAEIESIDYRWRSKVIDLEAVYLLGAVHMIAGAVGNWAVNVGVHFGLGLGDGASGTINFLSDGSKLGSIILGATVLAGSNYVFKTLEGVGGFGRFIQITLTPTGLQGSDLLGSSFVLGESELGSQATFRVKRIEVDLHYGREGGNDQ